MRDRIVAEIGTSLIRNGITTTGLPSDEAMGKAEDDLHNAGLAAAGMVAAFVNGYAEGIEPLEHIPGCQCRECVSAGE